MTTTATTFRPASEKQLAFISRLVQERFPNELATTLLTRYEHEQAEGTFSTAHASEIIDMLLSSPYRDEAPTAPLGMHRLDGVTYKVQASKSSGKPYAKKLVLTEPDCAGCANGEPEDCIDFFGHACEWNARFEYAPGIVRKLSEDTAMSLDEAKAFGSFYGTCVVCGATLTNPASIEAGIGPVCARKF